MIRIAFEVTTGQCILTSNSKDPECIFENAGNFLDLKVSGDGNEYAIEYPG